MESRVFAMRVPLALKEFTKLFQEVKGVVLNHLPLSQERLREISNRIVQLNLGDPDKKEFYYYLRKNEENLGINEEFTQGLKYQLMQQGVEFRDMTSSSAMSSYKQLG